jgi:hypothetical protein
LTWCLNGLNDRLGEHRFEHEVCKKHSSVGDLVRLMMIKRTRRWR